ncbi:MAG: urease subunit beta [Brevinematales bacterium]|nr:urease subunit beta [Brevinematales bacterium]
MSGFKDWYPGQVFSSNKEIELFDEKSITKITVTNTDDRPIQVGSHFHFFEANRALSFDRKSAYGKRLAIPSGTAVRFEPHKTIEVDLIDFAGKRVVMGFNSLVNGELDNEKKRAAAFEKAKKEGFKEVNL